MINENDVARVLDRTDILALIGEHVSLKKVGLRHVGLCPFHSEHTPSFSVNAEEGFYYCFGCHAAGDAISFVRAIDRLEFVQAVEMLASRAGISLTYASDDLSRTAGKRTALLSAVTKAAEFYRVQLRSESAEAARDYLTSRSIGTELWERFQLGWAPDSHSALFASLGVSEEVFVDAGLGYIDNSGRPADHLRGRIVFPIFDVSGRAIAFGGRILPSIQVQYRDRPLPKYKNSPETVLYSKRKALYGLNLAKADIVSKGEIVICEGYTDVIALFMAGIPRAVATCGTALTEDHFGKIKSYSKRIVLAFDADSAGASATEKFYVWERQNKLEIYVADLPSGMDPGELGTKDPELLRKAIANAKPFMEFRLDRLFASGDLSSIEGRASLADAAVSLIAEHPNALVRNDYLIRVADKCRFEMSLLHQKLEERLRILKFGSYSDRSGMAAKEGAAERDSYATNSGQGPIPTHLLGLEDRPAIEGLKVLVHNLADLADFFPPVLFPHPTHRALRLVLQGAQQISDVPTRLESASREVKELFIRLAVDAPATDPFDVVSRLVERAVNRRLERMKLESRHLEPDSLRLAELSSELSMIRHIQEELRDTGSRKIDATGKLLVWLVQGEE